MLALALAAALAAGDRPTVTYYLSGPYSTKQERLEIRALRRSRVRVRVLRRGRFDPVVGVVR